ncbi:unnamed protein product [Paramecium sonneborni]|uniref:Uncharacterized protein n=1 Tax=Paramecium sonneborni TaxID=65129 RepID=A0A8S1MHT8_9CILI|nr:unnamed protein product [Paramecium sonneborni]
MCKRCLRIVCSTCASYKISLEVNKGERLCKICKEESDSIKSFVDQNHIVYGVDTISKQWLGNDFNSQEYKIVSDPTKLKTEQVDINGLDNINYSLKDFYSLVGNDNIKLKNVCSTFCSKNPQIEFTPQLVCLANFLLCFSSESSAFQLLNIIYKQKPSEDCLISIVKYCVKGFNLSDNKDTSLMKQFLKEKLERYLITFSINMFNFDTTFFLISELIQKYDYFLRGLATIFMLASPNLQNSNSNELEVYILRNIRSIEVEKKLKTIQQFQTKQESDIIERTQSKMSQAFSVFEQQDPTQVNDLKTEISNLKLQLQLKDNEIESYKFQISQIQIPDEQKREKYLQQKSEEIVGLLSKIDELAYENQQYQNKECANQDFQLMFAQSQKQIEEKQKQIDRYKAKLKETSKDNRSMSLSQAGGINILSGKEVQELKQSFEDEKQLLFNQIKQLENSKIYLQKSLDAQKKLNQRVIDYISSMNLNKKLVELQAKGFEEKGTTYSDDYTNLLDIKNQQNQMLIRLKNTHLQQIEELKNKIKNLK